MDRGLQKIAMADDLDVDALLEAPYTKYEVGTTTDHVSFLGYKSFLWGCPLERVICYFLISIRFWQFNNGTGTYFFYIFCYVLNLLKH